MTNPTPQEIEPSPWRDPLALAPGERDEEDELEDEDLAEDELDEEEDDEDADESDEELDEEEDEKDEDEDDEEDLEEERERSSAVPSDGEPYSAFAARTAFATSGTTAKRSPAIP